MVASMVRDDGGYQIAAVADCFGEPAGHPAVPGELKQEREEKRMKKAKRGLALVTSCLVLMLVAACATSTPKRTDEELIDALTQGYLAALEAQDIDKMMTYFSEDFSNDQFGDKAGVRDFMESSKESGYLDDLEVDLSENQTTITGDTSTGGPAILNGWFGSIPVTIEGVKEEDGWKIVDMDIAM